MTMTSEPGLRPRQPFSDTFTCDRGHETISYVAYWPWDCPLCLANVKLEKMEADLVKYDRS